MFFQLADSLSRQSVLRISAAIRRLSMKCRPIGGSDDYGHPITTIYSHHHWQLYYFITVCAIFRFELISYRQQPWEWQSNT